jgi:hypothetical protein
VKTPDHRTFDPGGQGAWQVEKTVDGCRLLMKMACSPVTTGASSYEKSGRRRTHAAQI